MSAAKSTYRKWSPGLPTSEGVFALAARNDEGQPVNMRSVRSVVFGKKTVVVDLGTGDELSADDGEGQYHLILSRIKAPKATADATASSASPEGQPSA